MTQQNRTKVLASIEWFTPAFQAGGIISSLQYQINHLSDRLDFWVVCSNRDLLGENPTTPHEGVWHNRNGHSVQFITPPVPWKSIIEEVQPDIIYVNGLFNGPFCRELVGLKPPHIPMVVAAHGMLASEALHIKWWLKKPWLLCQRLIGTFESVRFHASSPEEASQISSWFPNNEIRIAQNLPPSLEKIESAPKPDIQFLSVGRVHPIKNYGFGAACLSEIARTHEIEVTYIIAGPEEHTDERTRIEAFNHNWFKTKFLGPLAPVELKSYFQESRALLVPSLCENFGQVVSEALANGLPVVVSDNTPWHRFKRQSCLTSIPLEPSIWLDALAPFMNLDYRTSLSTEVHSFYKQHLLQESIIHDHISMMTPW